MLHASLSAATDLKYKRDNLSDILKQAALLLRLAHSRATGDANRAGEDVQLGDVLADTVVSMGLSVEEARALLLVLGAARETIYERVLWQLAYDEARGVLHLAG